jgi:hypothetical protein
MFNLLPFVHRSTCRRTRYASQFGALKASLAGASVPCAHQCERCPNTWHIGPAPDKAVAA